MIESIRAFRIRFSVFIREPYALLRTINDALSTSMIQFSLIRPIVTIFSIETPYNLFFFFFRFTRRVNFPEDKSQAELIAS